MQVRQQSWEVMSGQLRQAKCVMLSFRILCVLVTMSSYWDLCLAGTTEKTSAVSSADGKWKIAVEWQGPDYRGEAIDFSSQMQVLVTNEAGQTVLQRTLDAPQVRSVQSPVWLNQRWGAFTYNIQKNYHGIVYLDMASGQIIQVEMIAPVRRMATGDTEADLTSLEVVEHLTTSSKRYKNITNGRASVFPLVVRPLPAYQGIPYPREFVNELRGTLSEYKKWLNSLKATDLEIEPASESFSPDRKYVTSLACLEQTEPDGSTTRSAYVVTVPLNINGPNKVMEAVKLVPLGDAVQLSSMKTAAPDVDEGMQDPMQAEPARYATLWSDARNIVVERETSDEEKDEPVREPAFLLSLDGETTRLAAADRIPKILTTETLTQDVAGDDKMVDRKDTGTVTGRSFKEPLFSPDVKKPVDKAPRPRRTPAPPISPKPKPGRIPTVSSPGVSSTQEPVGQRPTATPYTAKPIGNLLERFPGMGRDSEPAGPPTSPTPGSDR